jgi:drug/metabolite transporter (DMT)-like permease
VLLVVRPGFRELHLGHLTAAIGAVVSAAGTIALRMLGTTEKRSSVLAVTYSTAIAFNAVLMIPGFVLPRPQDFAVIGLGGVLAGFGQIAMLTAAKLAPPNRTSPAQYAQIISAVALGAIFFGEYPDAIAFAGMVLVVLSGLITFLREEQLHGWSARTLWMRNRSVG